MAEIRFDAARLQDLMKKRGVSDYKLGKLTGISHTMIYYLRKGERKSASAELITKLANALDTTVDYLLGEDVEGAGRVTVTVPEGVRQLTEIANRLSAARQEDLVRIAAALADLESERAATSLEQDLQEATNMLDLVERQWGWDVRVEFENFARGKGLLVEPAP